MEEEKEGEPAERRRMGGSAFPGVSLRTQAGFAAVFNFDIDIDICAHIFTPLKLTLSPILRIFGTRRLSPVPLGEFFGHPHKCKFSHSDWSGCIDPEFETVPYFPFDAFNAISSVVMTASGRVASPADEPVEGETRGGKDTDLEIVILDTFEYVCGIGDSDSESEVEVSLDRWR